MRVVLYYDLLRFSPRSIDLFISMNISPPQSTTLQKNKSTCLGSVRKASSFRWCVCIMHYNFKQSVAAFSADLYENRLKNGQVQP